MTEMLLVFDIGGTTTRAGIYDPVADCLVRSLCCPTPAERLFASLPEIAARLDLPCPHAVSVAFPGPVDPQGNAFRAPTIWPSRAGPVPVTRELEVLWPGAGIFVANDVTAAGMSYRRRTDETYCVVTVSSGIGNKVFVRGRPVVGPGGRGGEIGHLRVDSSPEAPRCDCGAQGHLGALASGRASAWHARRMAARDPEGLARSVLVGDPEAIDNRRLAAAFRAGDAWAAGLVTAMAAPLGCALAAIHSIVGVERFVVMGGFAEALGPAYLDLLAHAAAPCAWDLGQDWRGMLELGEAQDEAGLIGAGRLALLERP